jgi:hypothetical protein
LISIRKVVLHSSSINSTVPIVRQSPAIPLFLLVFVVFSGQKDRANNSIRLLNAHFHSRRLDVILSTPQRPQLPIGLPGNPRFNRVNRLRFDSPPEGSDYEAEVDSPEVEIDPPRQNRKMLVTSA